MFAWFPGMLTNSTPVRVDTKEVGHIPMLLPILEYSMLVGSALVPGLTSPRALRSRVLQALCASEDAVKVLRELQDFCPCGRTFRVLLEQVVHPRSPLSAVQSSECFFGCVEAVRCSSPESVLTAIISRSGRQLNGNKRALHYVPFIFCLILISSTSSG